jgi:hypothetical protein
MRYVLHQHHPSLDYYIVRYDAGQTIDQAVVSDPVTVDLANLAPVDFTSPAFPNPLVPALFCNFVEVYFYDSVTGKLAKTYTPTAAEYAAHFASGDEPLGVAATKTIG